MRMSQLLSKESGMTQEILTKLLREIDDGLPLRYAAAVAGVSYGKLKKWLGQGQEGIEPFDKLYKAVQKARAVPIKEQILHIQEAAASDPRYWQAAAWLLERLAPEEFAPQRNAEDEEIEMEVTIRIGGDREVNTNAKD